MKKYRTFTLLELLCCTVIVSVMLIIAIPSMKVVIDNSTLNSMKSSAILVLDLAEKKYTESMLLDENKNITCESVSNLIKTDYKSCSLSFDNNIAKILLIGDGRFKNYKCEGTKDSLCCTK